MFPCDVEITDFRLHTASGAPVLTLSFCADGKAQTLRFLSISDVTLRFPAIPMQICGFEIRDHRADGWDADQRYEISDFEDGALHFFCREIETETANRCRDAGKMENERPAGMKNSGRAIFSAKKFRKPERKEKQSSMDATAVLSRKKLLRQGKSRGG